MGGDDTTSTGGGRRHAGRRRAVEVLFEADVRRRPIDATLDRIDADPHAETVDDFARSLIRGVAQHVTELDAELDRHAHNWKVARMPLVDRNLLRLALYELRHGDATAAVVIDEAVELAKQLGGDDTPRFINGVLSAAHRASTADGDPPATAETG